MVRDSSNEMDQSRFNTRNKVKSNLMTRNTNSPAALDPPKGDQTERRLDRIVRHLEKEKGIKELKFNLDVKY